MTRVELAARRRKSRSFASEVEVGETRLDVTRPRTIRGAPGGSLRDFARPDARLDRDGRRPAR